ncbi:MAG: peptide chain release factor N(5)-glutamine methyltransferase [Alphaproteobacteria bacterium]|nr:peptide chain release factor N(5)-glutamine methyltransferase [Alphaproteobacteria bacterium]
MTGRAPAPGSVGALLDDATRRLAADGVEEARADARILLAHAMGRTGGRLYGEEDGAVTDIEAARFDRLVARRQLREPVSRIIGRRGFRDLDLEIGPATLDPRPDTETLVRAAAAAYPDRDRRLRVLDLGTGSGALLLALLQLYPRAVGTGVDLCGDCLVLAARNAERHGLAHRAAFREGSWCRGVSTRFDIILCNPPYVPSGTIDTLEPEVARFEPRRALDGGDDGLECYRELLPGLAGSMAPGATVFLEIGHDQRDRVQALAVAAGLAPVGVWRDLAGRERCLVLRSVLTRTAGPPGELKP